MVRGRARAAVAGAVVAVALVAAGCGAQSHPNEPRPQVSTRVSVTISPGAVTVQPGSVGIDEERTQQIPQNQNHEQPRIKHDGGPMNLTFVAANQTGENAHLVIHGTKEVKSGPVLARSPATFQADLPTGSYTIVATDIPGARPAHFTVGPYRASSENDVLLP
jgi:hypothetical protein